MMSKFEVGDIVERINTRFIDFDIGEVDTVTSVEGCWLNFERGDGYIDDNFKLHKPNNYDKLSFIKTEKGEVALAMNGVLIPCQYKLSMNSEAGELATVTVEFNVDDNFIIGDVND